MTHEHADHNGDLPSVIENIWQGDLFDDLFGGVFPPELSAPVIYAPYDVNQTLGQFALDSSSLYSGVRLGAIKTLGPTF